MKNYEYKCVEAPVVINTSKNSHGKAIQDYAKIINYEATGGWELDKIDTISSTQQAGCLALLSGKSAVTKTFKIFIFRKERS